MFETLDHIVTKLDPEALKCVFLGYSCLKRGYQYYSTELGMVSTDVVFSETTPFFYAPLNSTSQGEEKRVVNLPGYSCCDRKVRRCSSLS